MSKDDKEKEKFEKKLSSILSASTSAKAWSDLLPITREIYQLLSKSNTAINNLDKSMSNLEQVKSDCDKSKELSDKNYSLALNDYDAQGMEKYLEDSIEYEHCSSDARINYNAYKKLKNQLSYYHGVLKTKYNYFLEHKYDISQNMARKVK